MGGFSTVTPPPSQVSATSVAQTVWSYSPRSLTDIQSLVSAIQNNNPSLLSSLSDILYVPAPFYTSQVSATQVAAFLDNLVLNYGLAGPAAAAISASPYGLWSTNFVTQVIPYLNATSLNLLLSSGQMDANHAQLILYWLAQNYYYNKWVYTVTANATSSITFSTNTVLNQNVLIAQNITIASGVTVTCGTRTCFLVAQSFNNYGTVVAHGAPGGVPPGRAGPGGTGGGGIVVVAVTAVLGTLNVSGSPGGNAAGYTASGTGSGGSVGIFYVVSGVTVPLGGTGGLGTNGYIGAAGLNGGGGGAAESYYYGAPGGNATAVYLLSSPNTMATYILQGLSDWWITGAVGRSPTYVTPLAYMYGSGGGAGAEYSGGAGGGGGGGGAGEVAVYGYNIVSGTVNAAGGNGGYSASNCPTCYAGGGGGGGGGLVFIFYGATSGSVTANVAGGAGGISYIGSNGATGANGTAYIAKVTVNG